MSGRLPLAEHLALASLGVLLPGAAFAVLTQSADSPSTAATVAIATKHRTISTSLYETDGQRIGYAKFCDVNGEVEVEVKTWRGLTTGFHGLRIHANDDLNFWELRGRALTIHSGPDNYGNVPLGDGPTQYTANSRMSHNNGPSRTQPWSDTD